MIATRRTFLAGGLAVAGGVNGADQNAPVPKIGVVNLRVCFDKTKYARMGETAEGLVALKNELSQEAQTLQKRIADLTDQIKGSTAGSDYYFEKFKLRGHAEYDLKLLQEVAKRKLAARVGDGESRIYADVRRVVAALARQLGLDLVLRADEARLPEEDPNSGDRIATREILFNREELDLTSQVLDRLNKDWVQAWTCTACRRKITEEKCPDCGAKRP